MRAAKSLFFLSVFFANLAVADEPVRAKTYTKEANTSISSYLKNSDVFSCEATDSRIIDVDAKSLKHLTAKEVPCVLRIECAPKDGKQNAAKGFTFESEAGYLLACPGDRAKKQCPAVADCAAYAQRTLWSAQAEKTIPKTNLKVIETDRVTTAAKFDVAGEYFTQAGRSFNFLDSDSGWQGACTNFVDNPKAAKDSEKRRFAMCEFEEKDGKNICPTPSKCLENTNTSMIQVASIAPARNDAVGSLTPHSGVQQAGASFTSAFPTSSSSKGVTALPASKSHETRFGTTVRSQDTGRGATAGAPRQR